MWSSPTVGWELVTLPIVWQTTLLITIILVVINYKLKAPLIPSFKQILIITFLSLFGYWFIEYIQVALWIYEPCYKEALTFDCTKHTFISAVQFLFPVVLWGYNAIYLIPNLFRKLLKINYKRTLTLFIIVYLICGVIYLYKLISGGNLGISIEIYEQDYKVNKYSFGPLVAIVVVLTWPAILAIQLWASGY